MKHMHTTSLGLVKAVWLHNTQLTTKHKYQHKHDNSRHSLQNRCMQKTSIGAIRRWLPSLPARPHNALEEATCEKGTIQIFTQGMNEVIFLEKHLFFARRWTWRIFSKHNKHDIEVRLYSYVCSLGFNAWSALAQKYTGCWQSSWSWKSLKSDFIRFVSQVIFHSWCTFASKPKVDLCVFRKKIIHYFANWFGLISVYHVLWLN